MGNSDITKIDRDILVNELRDTVRGYADVYGIELPSGLVELIADNVFDEIIIPFVEEITDENHVLGRYLCRSDRPQRVP